MTGARKGGSILLLGWALSGCHSGGDAGPPGGGDKADRPSEASTTLHYGAKTLDSRSVLGIGDFGVRFIVDPQTDDLLWVKSGDSSSQLVRLPKDGATWNEAKASSIFEYGRRSFWDPKKAPDGKSTYFLADENNDETFNIYNFDGKALTQITHLGYLGIYSVNQVTGRLIYLGRKDKVGGTVCMEEIDPANGDGPDQLYCDQGGFQVGIYADPRVDANNQRVAFVLNKDGQGDHMNLAIYRRDTKTTDVVSDPAVGRSTLIPLGWRGDKLYLVSDEGTQTSSVYAYDDSTKKTSLIRQNKLTSANAFFDPASQRVVVIETADGKGTLAVVDTANDKTTVEADASGYNMWMMTDFKIPLHDGTWVIPVARTKGRGNLVSRIDPTATTPDGLLTTPFEPTESKAMAQPCEMQDVTYPIFDNGPDGQPRQIKALLFKPAVPVATPAALVYAHGGPDAEVPRDPVADTQVLCQLGYTVLGANVRGSTGQGQDFQNLNKNDIGGGDARDYEYARRYLVSQGIDPSRIGIMGESYGGYMTEWEITRPDNQFAFGIAIAGMSDLIYDSEHSDVASGLIGIMGDPKSSDAVKKLWEDRSPINYVANLQKPLLLVHGSSDNRVPTEESRMMYKALAALNKDVRYVEMVGEGHDLKYIGTQSTMLQAMLDLVYRVAPVTAQK
jgi:dipeptidyl aminopeptidase/acylaminoacyl peptidase